MRLSFSVFFFVILFPFLADSAIINLSWSDNSTNESGFYIERRLGNNNNNIYTRILTVPADTNSIDLPIDLYNIRHCYRIVSFNSSGVAQPSNNKCVTITIQ